MKVSHGRVIVTGATRGIGRATAESILERGGKVIAIARDEGKLDALRRMAPDRVRTLARDLSDLGDLRNVASEAIAAFGGADGLVNCAAIVRYERVGAIAVGSIEAQLRVNLTAPLLLSQAVAEHLRGRGGAIVNVSSTLAVRRATATTVYGATKAALNAITQTMALELAPDRVRINAVLPGVVDTNMIRAPRPAPGEPILIGEALETSVEARLESLRSQHPIGRLGRPEDVASVIVALLDHPWQTGSLVTIDGGLSLV